MAQLVLFMPVANLFTYEKDVRGEGGAWGGCACVHDACVRACVYFWFDLNFLVKQQNMTVENI